MAYLACTAAFVLCYLAPGMLVRIASREKYEQRIPLTVLLVEGAVLSFWLLLLPGLLISRFNYLNATVVLTFLSLLICIGAISIFRTDNEAFVKYPIGLLAALLVLCFHGYEAMSSPAVRGGFFYLSEIKSIALASGLPAKVHHFGEDIVPQLDKLGFDYTGAFYYLLSGGKFILELKLVGYLGFTLLSAMAAMLFFAQFTSPLLAAAASLAVFSNVFLSIAPTLRNFFIPESVALFFCFAAWFSVLRLREAEHPKWPLNFAGLALAAAAITHMEIGLIAAIGTATTLIALAILNGKGIYFRQLIYLGFFSLIFFGGSYVVIGTYPAFLDKTVDESSFFDDSGADVTWGYFRASDERYSKVDAPEPRGIKELLLKISQDSGLAYGQQKPLLTICFLLLFSFLISLMSLKKDFGTSRVGPALAFSASVSSALLLFLAYFSESSLEAWVYRTEATRRVAPYISIFILVVIFSGIQQFLNRFSSKSKSGFLAVIFTLPFLLLSVASLKYIAPIKTPFPVTSSGLAAIDWAKENIGENETILSNLATNGAFHTLAERKHLLEGHQPMLRPELVERTNSLLLNARAFFSDPESNHSFINDNSVDYVIASEKPDFGGTLVGRAFASELTPSFLCKEWEKDHLRIYKICP